jgi:hypothetical protein
LPALDRSMVAPVVDAKSEVGLYDLPFEERVGAVAVDDGVSSAPQSNFLSYKFRVDSATIERVDSVMQSLSAHVEMEWGEKWRVELLPTGALTSSRLSDPIPPRRARASLSIVGPAMSR